jgi:hypothetical protein
LSDLFSGRAAFPLGRFRLQEAATSDALRKDRRARIPRFSAFPSERNAGLRHADDGWFRNCDWPQKGAKKEISVWILRLLRLFAA